MLRHVEQLQPVFERNADVINYLPLGLVGKWGEFNKAYSKLGIEDNTDFARSGRRQLLDLVLQALPKQIMTALRYPEHYREIYGSKRVQWNEAYGETNQARTGLFYDFYPASYDEDDYNMLSEITRFTVFGGEGVPSSYNEGKARNAVREMAATHWQHMQPMFQSEFRRFGIYDELIKRIGYRYVLKVGEMPSSVAPNDVLRISLTVQNQGFANLHRPKHIDVVLRDIDGNLIRAKAYQNDEEDARRILPLSGITKTFQLAAQLEGVASGNYDVFLHVKDVFPSIANRPEYSIRFANQNTWQSQTGLNRLGSIAIN